MDQLRITALSGLGDFNTGDDLATIIAGTAASQSLILEDGDIIVVAQKIISKVENRIVDLNSVIPSERAREIADQTHKDPALVELVLRESSDVVRASPGVLIVRHRNGYVMANAGIDASNLQPGEGERRVLLLPEDADISAARLRQQLADQLGLDLGVVISDSFGRPWRHGVTNVAIGAAGVPALLDRRNESDRYGRTLEVTQVAIGDLLAASAGLLMGEGSEGKPIIIVQGLTLPTGRNRPARDIVRPVNEDLFR